MFCFTDNLIEVDLKASEINAGFSLDSSALKIPIIKSGKMYAARLEGCYLHRQDLKEQKYYFIQCSTIQ